MTKEEIKQALKNDLNESGRRVYTCLRHVSASGMTRSISLFVSSNNQIIDIDYWAASVMGYKIDNKHGGLRVQGCGMDMGYHLVYNLGRTLWPNGDGETVTHRNGSKTPETDGGYLLRQEWI